VFLEDVDVTTNDSDHRGREADASTGENPAAASGASDGSADFSHATSAQPALSADTSPAPESWIFVDAVFLGDRYANIYVFQDESGKWKTAMRVHPVQAEIRDRVSQESSPVSQTNR
jgi:hypothetical protein